jgi:nitrite reductase/ring-hydroxylating ferredoxin subunit
MSCDRRDFLQSAACLGFLAALPVTFVESIAADQERRFPIPASDSVNIDRSAQMILVRYQGHVFVFALSCPHQNYALKWVEGDHRFHCTKHDSVYEEDGRHISGRATRNMDRYAVRRDGDAVVVDIHNWFESNKDPNGWNGAAIAV